jgi:hypothetical protein
MVLVSDLLETGVQIGAKHPTAAREHAVHYPSSWGHCEPSDLRMETSIFVVNTSALHLEGSTTCIEPAVSHVLADAQIISSR